MKEGSGAVGNRDSGRITGEEEISGASGREAGRLLCEGREPQAEGDGGAGSD